MIEQLRELLDQAGADYTLSTDEKTLKSAQEGANYYGIELRQCTPTLIVQADGAYYAVILAADTKLSFDKLKQELKAHKVSLVDPATIQKLTQAGIGYVSLINPTLPTLIDALVLRNDYCYGGAGVAQKTLRIKTDDLIAVSGGRVVDVAEPR